MMRTLCCSVAILGLSGSLFADYYADEVGDIFDPGLTNLDLVGAELTNTDTELIVSMDFVDLGADWGKYLFMIDRVGHDGQSMTNPWERTISTPGGIDGFLGSWIDGGGGALTYMTDESAGWIDTAGAGLDIDWEGDRITYTIALTSLGLSVGDSFTFEVATTGGNNGDPAIDLLGTGDVQPGWGGGSASPMVNSYTVVPAPGAICLALVLGRSTRRRRN